MRFYLPQQYILKLSDIGKQSNERSVKDIQLYFDASKNNNYVLTCGTVHRTLHKDIVRFENKIYISI